MNLPLTPSVLQRIPRVCQRKSGAAGTTQRKLGLPVACLHGAVEGRSPCYLAMEVCAVRVVRETGQAAKLLSNGKSGLPLFARRQGG